MALSFKECLSKYPCFVGIDQTPDKLCGSKGLEFERPLGSSSGFHAPGEYPFVPYVCAKVTHEHPRSTNRTATEGINRFRILKPLQNLPWISAFAGQTPYWLGSSKCTPFPLTL